MCKFALRKIGGKLLFYSYQRRTEDQRWVGETSLPTFLVFFEGWPILKKNDKRCCKMFYASISQGNDDKKLFVTV